LCLDLCYGPSILRNRDIAPVICMFWSITTTTEAAVLDSRNKSIVIKTLFLRSYIAQILMIRMSSATRIAAVPVDIEDDNQF
jgi:hypothetical protein